MSFFTFMKTDLETCIEGKAPKDQITFWHTFDLFQIVTSDGINQTYTHQDLGTVHTEMCQVVT